MARALNVIRSSDDLKRDFPALSRLVNGRTVTYLDSAASAQKPQCVIDAMTNVMTEHYANVHRGVYTFSAETSLAFEGARKKVAQFLNAKTEKEIVFTRNATEAINLVAHCFGQSLKAGDEIILTELEHHANIVPWYFLKEQKGVVLKIVPIRPDRSLDMEAFEKLLSAKTKLVAVTQMSNVLGTIVPVAEIVKKAHAVGAKVLVDASQSIVHFDVDVQQIGCDFCVFTGHKLYGPSGVGVLYGRYDILNAMPPYQGGGEMIELVSFDKITYKEAPFRFEAGTPAIVDVIGLGAAIDYMNGINKAACLATEQKLLHEAEKRLAAIPGLKIYSTAPERASIISFTIDKIHPHDIATVFDQLGVAVRTGHHCAQPLMKALGVSGTVRASFALYNTMEDVERLEAGVQKVKKLFS